MSHCRRCKREVGGKVFIQNGQPRPVLFTKPDEFKFPDSFEESDVSCVDCLKPHELAHRLIPVACFVVEQMMQGIKDNGRGDGQPLMLALMRLRSKFLYDCGPALGGRVNLTAHAKDALLGSGLHTVYERDLSKFSEEELMAEIARRRNLTPFTFVADESVPANELQLRRGNAHLNRAQRRFICDVGTRSAYADGGKRLAELTDAEQTSTPHDDSCYVCRTGRITEEPEPSSGTDSNMVTWACVVSLVDCPRCGAERGKACTTLPGVPSVTLAQPHRERVEAAEAFPKSKNVAPTGDGRLKVEESGWVCTNHPEGLEIAYPATTQACEVCGRGQGD